MRKFAIRAVGVIAVMTAVMLVVVTVRPPELIRIGAAYTAKTVCSNVFLARRDPARVLSEDVLAPGHPLLRLMQIRIDREHGVVSAGLFGFIGDGLAQWRQQGGCTVLPDGKLDTTSTLPPAPPPSLLAGKKIFNGALAWPDGNEAQTDPLVDRLLSDGALAGPGVRAIVVVSRGRIVGERYADAFDAFTPQLGWSMTKSVLAGLIGILVKDGRLTLDQTAGWPATDERGRISIANLLAMSSGLRFNESYGAISDVTRMLYLQPDMAAFARTQPLQHSVGTVWSYSSGSALILSRLYQDAAGADALALMNRRLFEPLGMTSAVMETDEHGTLVGSSYLYATPRDWARYGQLLCADGVWQGREILPRGFVAMMASPATVSGGEYGQGLVWRRLNPGDKSDEDAGLNFPGDLFWMVGHDGQYIAVIPSRQLVLVRMGLTPTGKGYRPQPLLRQLLAALL